MAESEHRHPDGSRRARSSEPGSARATRPVLVDVVLAVVVATAVALAIAAKVEPEARNPDVFAYLFAVGLGALMLVRRSWPTGVLVMTVVALFAYYLIGYPAVGVAVPVAGAVYSAAEQGRLRSAIVIATLVLVLSTLYRLTEESAVRLLGFEGAQNLVLLVAVIALGDSVRARGELRRQSQLRAEQAERDHERSAREQVEQERVRIAREVHDVLAHAVSAITIQSAVGLEALPAEPDAAADALRSIRQVSTTALSDLRGAVGVLRDPARPLVPVGGLADLDRLVTTAAESGLEVVVQTIGHRSGIPLVVDAAAYRIVQESITNALKHSGAPRVIVTVDSRPEELGLRINSPPPTSTRSTGDPGADGSDLVRGHLVGSRSIDAAGGGSVSGGWISGGSIGGGSISSGLIGGGSVSREAAGGGPVGFGITGMRERVELLGGTLQAGPTAEGGFEVAATLPLPRTAVPRRAEPDAPLSPAAEPDAALSPAAVPDAAMSPAAVSSAAVPDPPSPAAVPDAAKHLAAPGPAGLQRRTLPSLSDQP